MNVLGVHYYAVAKRDMCEGGILIRLVRYFRDGV